MGITTALEGTELLEVIQHLGIVIPPNDIDATIQAIFQLTSSPEAQQQLWIKSVELFTYN